MVTKSVTFIFSAKPVGKKPKFCQGFHFWNLFLKIFILQAQLLRVLYDDVFHGFRSSPSKQVAPAIFTYAKDMSNLKVAREEGITRFWLKDISSIHSGTCVCVFFGLGAFLLPLSVRQICQPGDSMAQNSNVFLQWNLTCGFTPPWQMSCFLFVLFLYVEIPFDKLPLVTLTLFQTKQLTVFGSWLVNPPPPNVPPEKIFGFK